MSHFCVSRDMRLFAAWRRESLPVWGMMESLRSVTSPYMFHSGTWKESEYSMDERKDLKACVSVWVSRDMVGT